MKKKIINKENLLITTGFFLLLAGWQLLSVFMHDLIISSPSEAITSLYDLIVDARFNEHFFPSLKRITLGIFMGSAAGFGLGVVAGLNNNIRYLLEPLRWLLMSIPPIILVVLGMLWFGMGSTMVVFIISIVIAPVVYISTCKGIEMVDTSLVEMTRIYGFSFLMRLRHLYLPAIIGPLSAALVIITGSAARMVVMAELLGANNGIGFAIGDARSNLEIPELFAWVVSVIAIVAMFEFVFLKPLQSHFSKWKA